MALQAQEALLQAHWDPNVLLLQHCCPVLDSEDRVLYAGPRVRMGIYEGTPLRIQPHASSGRADYFGRLVNRWILECTNLESLCRECQATAGISSAIIW